MSNRGQLTTEQEHQRKAFEVYLSLGEKRTYRSVATQLGVSASTVKLWSRSFRWTERIAERDAQVARELADRSLQSAVDETERNLKIVRVALMKLAKGIADGKVKMQLGDLDRLIRLETFLRDGTDGKSPRTAEEVLIVLQSRWVQFSPAEQHAAMDKVLPGWRNDLKEEAALRHSGPVLVLPADNEHFKYPVLVLPDNGSAPKPKDTDGQST